MSGAAHQYERVSIFTHIHHLCKNMQLRKSSKFFDTYVVCPRNFVILNFIALLNRNFYNQNLQGCGFPPREIIILITHNSTE